LKKEDAASAGKQSAAKKSDDQPASNPSQDLNSKLEAKFEKNLKTLQDSLTKITTELEALQKDFNQRQQQLLDKVEVDRCVQDIVSWVSEQVTNAQVVENLNKVARKVNQIGEKVYANSGGSPP
jgi:hypothetical protein